MNQTDQRATMLDRGSRILTNNLLRAKICSTNTRAIAQLVEQLVYTCAKVFQGSSSCNKKNLIDKSMSYSMTLWKQENNSLTISSVQLGCPFSHQTERLID